MAVMENTYQDPGRVQQVRHGSAAAQSVAGATETADNKRFTPPTHQHHVYGGRAAMEIQSSETRETQNRTGTPTVNIDFAVAESERKYDWRNKVVFQVTPSELLDLSALLLGYLSSVKFEFHNGKTMFVSWKEDGNIVFGLLYGERKFGVPVSTKYDRMCLLNACLYSLAKGQKIPITEARHQIEHLYRRPVDA